MSYQEITTSLLAKHQKIVPLKRSLKTLTKGFRPKSPNDIDKILYVAVLLWVIDCDDDAISLLRFVDQNADIRNATRMLLGSVAFSRLVLAELYKQRGDLSEEAVIMAKDDLDAGYNLTSDANPVRAIVQERLDDWEFYSNDSESTPKNHIDSAYFVFMPTTILLRRLKEVEEQTTDEDKKLLIESHIKFKEILKSLLVPNVR